MMKKKKQAETTQGSVRTPLGSLCLLLGERSNVSMKVRVFLIWKRIELLLRLVQYYIKRSKESGILILEV